MEIGQQVITALIGLCIGTLLGNEISRFLYRPKVIVKFKQLTPLKMKDGFFWSIQIANQGRTAALNCTGTISLFDLKNTDVLEPYDALIQEALPSYKDENLDLEYPRKQLISPSKFRDLRNCSLCWSTLGNPSEVNINPGTIQELDICRVQYHSERNYWYLIFPSEKGWRKVRLRLKVANLTGRILVCPSNEFPTVLDFRILQRGNKEPTFEQINYRLISRLRRYFNKNELYFG